MRGLRGTPPALPGPFSPSPPALGSLAVFFPCLLRSRPRRPLPGASETAWDNSRAASPASRGMLHGGQQARTAPAVGNGAGKGFGAGDRVRRDMESCTASSPPQPARRDRASPATSDRYGKYWGAPGWLFPHPTAPNPARDGVKAPFRDGVGKLPPSHASPGCAGRVLLCPRDTSVPLAHSVRDWSRPLLIVWTSHHVIHFVSTSCAGPKGHQNAPLHPNEFVGHPNPGLGSKASPQLPLSRAVAMERHPGWNARKVMALSPVGCFFVTLNPAAIKVCAPRATQMLLSTLKVA